MAENISLHANEGLPTTASRNKRKILSKSIIKSFSALPKNHSHSFRVSPQCWGNAKKKSPFFCFLSSCTQQKVNLPKMFCAFESQYSRLPSATSRLAQENSLRTFKTPNPKVMALPQLTLPNRHQTSGVLIRHRHCPSSLPHRPANYSG